MKERMLTAAMLGAASLALAVPAMAYTVQVDKFSVSKNGYSAWFVDTFSDGLAPPNNPQPPFPYSVFGTVGPEIGGRLTMDQSGAVLGLNSLNQPRLVQQVLLETNYSSTTDTNDPSYNFGLKKWNDFTVSGLFDYSVPSAGDIYGIRLGDLAPVVNSGDDRLLLVVGNPGAPSIMFVDQDYINFTQVSVGGLPNVLLPSSGFDQIRLNLSHAAGSTDITASWELLASGGFVSGGSWGSFGSIFSNENYTRAALITAAVPEPSSYAMLLAGLGLLSFAARRRKQKAV